MIIPESLRGKARRCNQHRQPPSAVKLAATIVAEATSVAGSSA